jgi:hypothetical protein
MPENAIIEEIHQRREALARQCDFDADKLIAHYRQREAERNNASHPLVMPEEVESCMVREEPPKR